MSSSIFKNMAKEDLIDVIDSFEKVSCELLSCDSSEALYSRIIENAMVLTSADGGSFYLQKTEGSITFMSCKNSSFETEIPPGEISLVVPSIATHCFNTAQCVLCEDVYLIDKSSGISFNPKLDQHQNYRTKSMIAVPVKSLEGKTLGVIQLLNKKNYYTEKWELEKVSEMPSFQSKDLEIIERFSRLVAASLSGLLLKE